MKEKSIEMAVAKVGKLNMSDGERASVRMRDPLELTYVHEIVEIRNGKTTDRRSQ